MFDLEQSISEWRKQMLAVGIKTPAPLEELEIHLRETIEQQTKSGLDEPAAFAAAVQKIGKANMLKNEFKKIDAINKTHQWKFLEGFFAVVTFLCPLLVGWQIFFSTDENLSSLTAGQKIFCTAAAIAFSLLACAVRWGGEKFPAIQTSRIRDFIFVPVMLWLVTLAYVVMPHGNFSESQRAVLSLWGFAPFGMVIGWLWGFANVQKKAANKSYA
jgi:hypothetical protein